MKKIFTLFSVLIISSFLYSQSFDFEWQNPKVTGNVLNDIWSLTDSRLLVFGDVATLLNSTDGGTTWSGGKIDGVANDFKAAFFLDENTGFACGSEGFIIKTTDGGLSGFPSTSNTTETLWDIEFVDANTGYAVGNAGVIIQTTDGGATWNQVTSPVSNTIYAVHILSADTMFIGTTSTGASQILSRTTDGGATWQNVAPAGFASSVYTIKFVDGITGYAGCSSGKVLKTTNSGASFTEIKDFGSDANYSLYFSDTQTGYVPSGSLIYKTTDGGTNWTTLNFKTETLRGITANANGLFVVGSYGVVIKSTDQGTTWTHQVEAAARTYLREITFVNNTTGYVSTGSTTAADSSGFILKTTDAGFTWTKMPYNFKYSVFSLAMPTLNTWYAVTGNNKIFKSTDAGENWTQQTNPASGTTNLYEIEFADENFGYAVGLNGKCVKTTDGGTTWTNVTTPFGTAAIYDMKVFDAQTVIIVGNAAGAYKTTNGGTNWTQLTTGIPGNFFSVEFLNNSFGVIAGFSSSVSYLSISKDGGNTWTPAGSLPSDIVGSVWGIGIKDTNHIWVSDVNGVIAFTVDGGTTWTAAYSFCGNGLHDIAIVGNDMWLAGSGGSIIKGYSDPTVPVELTSFSYSKAGDAIVLNWKTATETNNKGFNIERKSSGGWESIGFVAGSGNSTTPVNYSFTDRKYPAGNVSYRLKQMDYDGSFKYSDVIEIDGSVPAKFELGQNYPNPFNPTTKIIYSVPEHGITLLKVYDMLGREIKVLVNKYQEAGEYTIDFNASDLTSGMYLYELNSGTSRITKKMILIK